MLDLILYYVRNIPNTRHGFTPHELLFLKPTPFILSTIKSLWLFDSHNPVNVPQFIADLDKQFACHNHVVKSSLQSKQSSDRISKESELASKFHVGDLVFKRNPGLNSCLDSSWDGPFIITALLPPVNCELVPHKSKGRKKIVHLSQLKRTSENTVLRVAIVSNDTSPHFDLSPRQPYQTCIITSVTIHPRPHPFSISQRVFGYSISCQTFYHSHQSNPSMDSSIYCSAGIPAAI